MLSGGLAGFFEKFFNFCENALAGLLVRQCLRFRQTNGDAAGGDFGDEVFIVLAKEIEKLGTAVAGNFASLNGEGQVLMPHQRRLSGDLEAVCNIGHGRDFLGWSSGS